MILVTGACGYIGSHFVLACRDAGRGVVALDDLSNGHADAIAPEVPLLWGDFSDETLIDRAVRHFGVTAAVHFAAKISVPESMANPALYWSENATKTASLARMLSARGVQTMVFSSTAAVYGPPAQPWVHEETPTRPVSPYGASKLAAERAIRNTPGLRHVILRYFNVAGADPWCRAGSRDLDPSHLFGRLCGVATGRFPHLDVFGVDWPTPDGTAIRDYLHVSDLARAHLDALDHLARGGQNATFNCGYGRGTSVTEAVDVMRRTTGHPIPLKHHPRRDGDIAEIIADATAIQRDLGWTPRWNDMDRIARHMLDFARSGIAAGGALPHRAQSRR